MKLALYTLGGLVTAYILIYFVQFRYILFLAPNPVIAQVEKEFGSIKNPTIRYIAAGDSSALGLGASTIENTYPYKIAQHLAAEHHVIYKNIGVSGARLKDVREKQLQEIIAFDPDIITISIGGNDIDRLASKKYVLENFEHIISELTTKTDAQIYIANLPNFTGAKLIPHPYIWMIEHRSAPINEEIFNLESDRVKIANIHDFFGMAIDVPRTYSADYFHPSDYGYDLWTKAFLEKIK